MCLLVLLARCDVGSSDNGLQTDTALVFECAAHLLLVSTRFMYIFIDYVELSRGRNVAD
jgi:hypothetical protein